MHKPIPKCSICKSYYCSSKHDDHISKPIEQSPSPAPYVVDISLINQNFWE